ncbi:hypothetical protein [Alicyclobacillus mengziensis]|uniref:Uncharacterized protein n=1 Tax=Alicyclobacillus mengziensis TaxID=2931921 RepID=A0A9X7W3S1_9BACL|nr:hypothetical protein [Alicyclobacillus mengziensis]QSO50141.1 hypothetical protein JZ786_24555 [Alicyclobacillus mengziensis]
MSQFLIRVIIACGIVVGMVLVAGVVDNMNQSAKAYIPGVLEHPTLHLGN